MDKFRITIDGDSTEFLSDNHWTYKIELGSPFRYSTATEIEKQIVDFIATDLNLCIDSDSVVSIGECEEIPTVNIPLFE